MKQTNHRLNDFVTPEYPIALFLFFYSSPPLPFPTFVSAFWYIIGMGDGTTASFCAKYFYSLSLPSLSYSQHDELDDVLLEPIERVADSPRGHSRNLHIQLTQNRVETLLRVVREERHRCLHAILSPRLPHLVIEPRASQ